MSLPGFLRRLWQVPAETFPELKSSFLQGFLFGEALFFARYPW